MIIWLTGQPGSGKTTLCKQMMLNMSSDVFHIDGDDLRDLFDNKDYSEVGRRKNIELAQQISEYLHNKGKHVFVSLVSPYKDQRDKFKSKMGDNLFEVYLYTSEIRGREDYFVNEYEPPTEKYLRLDTTNDSVEDSVKKVLEYAKIHVEGDPKLKNTGGKQYSMFVGRFQPFHAGHRWIVDEILNEGKNVLICIRDIEPDDKNPYTSEEVYNNVSQELSELIGEGRVKVIIIPDIESVNFGRGVGYDIIEHIPPQEVSDISATKIREQLRQEGKLRC